MNKPIRIAQVMGKMVGGGLEAVVMNYFRHIDRDQIQFDFIVDSDSTIIPQDEIESLGGRIIQVAPYQHVFDYMKETEKLFRKEQYPIVHAHMNALSVFPLRAAKRAGIPIRIAHSHSTAGKGEFARNTMKAVLKTQANRYPTHRLACSQHAGEWLFGQNSNFDVLYNAIELDKFVFSPDVRKQIRTELGLNDDQFVIGHIGRFTTQKNHAFLLDVFEQVTKHNNNAVLILAGSGELIPYVKNWINEHQLTEKILLLGQRNDTEWLYQAFDVFALPSIYEGLGMVAIEAQRAGLPCLLSTAVPREVELTGRCEFLPLDNERLWVEHLCDLAADPLPSRINTNDINLFKNYDINSAASNLVEFYFKALEEAGYKP